MSNAYTTSTYVQDELMNAVTFSTSSIPSLDTVNRWIGEVADEIDLLAARSFSTSSFTEKIDYDGSDRIQLKYAPVQTVTSITYSKGILGSSQYSLANTAVENTHFYTNLNRGEIIPIFLNWTPLIGPQTVVVNYVAGPTVVPGFIQSLASKMVAKRAMDSVMADVVRQKKSGVSVGIGNARVTTSSIFGVTQYRTISEEIATLKTQVVQGTGVYRYGNYL